MNINVRLLLITFAIVVLVTVSSTIIFLSTTNFFFDNKNSEIILDAANNFEFRLQEVTDEMDDEFKSLITNSSIDNIDLSNSNLDFILIEEDKKLIIKENQKIRKEIFWASPKINIADLIDKYPNILVKNIEYNNKNIFYGKFVTKELLNNLSEQVGADISLIIDYNSFLRSNEAENEKYLLNIFDSIKKLKFAPDYQIHKQKLSDAYFYATILTQNEYLPKPNSGFLVFNMPTESIEYASTMRLLVVIIIIAGIALALIFTLLFTTKMRKQISLLSNTAEVASLGEFDKRIPIISKDEIGKFAETFNHMLNELQKKELQEKEYTEFLALLNQNPKLKKISETALEKIIRAGDYNFGALYFIEDDQSRLVASYGIGQGIAKSTDTGDIYAYAIKKKELVEFVFNENFPVIRSGTVEIFIKVLLIFPILFNNEVIGIIELASSKVSNFDIKAYLKRINNELAIGLVNARALEKLENLVLELKSLNEEYQKQNRQISTQNKSLMELHQKLQGKARELEKQKTKAEELTKVKSQFLANMSHELRTPLNSILGLSELVLNDKTTLPKTKERLSVVVRNGNKLLALINNILEFSKTESGKIEIKVKEFLLSDFLAEINSFIYPLVSEKGLEFISESDDKKDYVLSTDKTKLDQILTNLLSNAVKFTQNGFIKLRVKEINENGILFSVKDTGIGIPESEKSLVFEEFRQLKAGNNREFGGTGLGLAICKRYVDLLGGKLSFRSRENEGSEFSVSFPGIIKRIISKPIHKKDLELYQADKRKNVAVLINPIDEVQKIIKDYLSNNHFELISCNNFRSGLNTIYEKRPDFVIINTELQEENGWELFHKIKKDKEIGNIPVMLTTFSSTNNFGYGHRIEDALIQPFDVNKVKSVISLIIGSKNISTKIFVINDNKENYKILENEKTLKFQFYTNKDFKLLTDVFIQNRPNLIFVKISENTFNELDFIFELKNDYITKEIPVVLILPENMDGNILDKLNYNTKTVITKGKYHRFDVLKILRDRLKLEVNKSITQKLFEEEGGDEVTVLAEREKIDPEKTILIVDDDPDTLFTVGELIETLGYKTIYANNGLECLIMLNNVKPDLILLDIMMPQMDGFETIKKIKDNEELLNIPVIALTAHAMLEDKEIIDKNGFDGLITKPLNRLELAYSVKNFISKKKVNLK